MSDPIEQPWRTLEAGRWTDRERQLLELVQGLGVEVAVWRLGSGAISHADAKSQGP
jgi:hypothetical protein